LEELSNHYTLLCNRAKAKLSGEERTAFESQLKQLQQILSFNGDGEIVHQILARARKSLVLLTTEVRFVLFVNQVSAKLQKWLLGNYTH